MRNVGHDRRKRDGRDTTLNFTEAAPAVNSLQKSPVLDDDKSFRSSSVNLTASSAKYVEYLNEVFDIFYELSEQT